jgi:general secretion pathway protein D
MFRSPLLITLLTSGLLIAQDAPKAPAQPVAPAAPAPAPDGAPPGPGGPPPGGPGAFGPGGPGGGRGFGRRGGFGPGEGAAGEGEAFQITGEEVMMQFVNNPVSDILAIYERLTGFTLIKDTNILDGATISLVTPKPVPKAEAIKLIEASLITNGYAIISEPGGKSAKILPARNQSAQAVQFSHGVRFYTSPQDIPTGESIITYFMKLENVAPEDAAEMFSGHVGLGAYGRITPVVTPPGVLITESATVVKQLISIRDTIDVGDTGSSLVTKFIPIQYADAATIAQIITATLTAQAQEKETKGVNTIRGNVGTDGRGDRDRDRGNDNNNNNRPQPPVVVNGVLQQGGSQMPQPSAQVVADTRLNQLLVVASPADYTYIASLIAEFDKPVDVDEPYERQLKYAAALDVLSAVVDLLQDPTAGTVQLPGGGTIQQQRQQALASNSSQLLGGRTTTNSRGGQVGSTAASAASDTATSTTTTSTGSRADVISGPTVDNAPVSVLVGKTRVIADPMANAIIVIGPKESIDKATILLDRLDRRPSQVYLATVIGQLTLTDGMKSGVDYLSGLSKPGDNNFSANGITGRQDFLGGLNGAGRMVNDLRTNATTTPFGPAAGLGLYGAIGDSLEIFVTALETRKNFKVLSRPSVFALNNRKAVITSGQKIPYPQTTTTFGANQNNNGSITSTAEYLDVVLKLEVVPLINPDGEVNLTISQINDTIIGERTIAPNTVPIIGTEQLVTSVNVPDRNTIVLGGLISESKTKDTQGLPFLGRIPGLGKLFRTDTDNTERKELVIFIQPQVVGDDNSLRTVSRREDLRSQVGAEAAKHFPEQIPATAPVESLPEKKKWWQGLFHRQNQGQ